MNVKKVVLGIRFKITIAVHYLNLSVLILSIILKVIPFFLNRDTI